MKIALPLAGGELSPHFGHCEAFALFTVEEDMIVAEETGSPEEHGCGSYPQYLKALGCSVVIAGGIGMGAQNNLQAQGIEVYPGVCPAPLRQLVQQYLDGTLEKNGELCSHEHHEHGEHGEHSCGHH